VKMLLDAGAFLDLDDKDRKGERALFRAIDQGNKEIIKLLLNSASKHDIAQSLSDAIIMGHKDAVEVLLNKRADPNTFINKNYSALSYAIVKGKKDIFKLLLNAPGVFVNGITGENSLPLYNAIDSGETAMVKMLLDAGAFLDLDDKDRKGERALFRAIDQGNEKIVRMLLQAGADVNDKNKNGDTPLSLAFEKRNEKIFNLIFKKTYKKDFQKS
ncbi:unnamed protein product, partial [marine sediment metagenome]